MAETMQFKNRWRDITGSIFNHFGMEFTPSKAGYLLKLFKFCQGRHEKRVLKKPDNAVR